MGTTRTRSPLGLLACAALLVGGALGCGGDDEGGTIPREGGDQLIAQLNQVEEQVELGECEAARNAAV